MRRFERFTTGELAAITAGLDALRGDKSGDVMRLLAEVRPVLYEREEEERIEIAELMGREDLLRGVPYS